MRDREKRDLKSRQREEEKQRKKEEQCKQLEEEQQEIESQSYDAGDEGASEVDVASWLESPEDTSPVKSSSLTNKRVAEFVPPRKSYLPLSPKPKSRTIQSDKFPEKSGWAQFWYACAGLNFALAVLLLVAGFASSIGIEEAITYCVALVVNGLLGCFFGYMTQLAVHIRWLLAL